MEHVIAARDCCENLWSGSVKLTLTPPQALPIPCARAFLSWDHQKAEAGGMWEGQRIVQGSR